MRNTANKGPERHPVDNESIKIARIGAVFIAAILFLLALSLLSFETPGVNLGLSLIYGLIVGVFAYRGIVRQSGGGMRVRPGPPRKQPPYLAFTTDSVESAFNDDTLDWPSSGFAGGWGYAAQNEDWTNQTFFDDR